MHKPMQHPSQQRVLVDLDGTLALTDHRKHFVETKACTFCRGSGIEDDFHEEGGPCTACNGRGKDKPNWPAFFDACVDDSPNAAVIQVVRMLSISYPITIVSGRSDAVMEQTFHWLHQNGVIFSDIIMRAEGDYTPDHELKSRWADEYNWNAETILCVLDDRDSVVTMWRARGIPCLQVAEGNF